MAANDPLAANPGGPPLSVEEADRLASSIRPSWELDDELPTGILLEGAAAPILAAVDAAGPPKADTIIEGIPTVSIGSAPSGSPARNGAPGVTLLSGAALAPEPEELALDDLVDAPEAARPPPRPGKTRVGMGDADDDLPTTALAGSLAPAEGLQLPPVRPEVEYVRGPASGMHAPMPGQGPPSRPQPSRPGASRSGSGPASARAPESTDDLKIPVNGASRGTLIKIGVAVLAVAGIAIGAKVLLGGSSTPDPKTRTATTATATAAPVTPPALPPASAAATPTTTAAAQPTGTAQPTVATPTPPPVQAVPPPTTPSPPPVPPAQRPPPATGTPPRVAGPAPGSGKKPAGGPIIRETPF